MIAGEQLFGGGEAAREDLAQGVEEARFIVAGGVEIDARLEAGFGDGEDALAELAQSLAPGRQGPEAELGSRVAEPLALLHGPVHPLVPGGIERGLIGHQARTEVPRVGIECVSTWRYRWSPF